MYGPIPKETLAEVLVFLAEKEVFPSLKEFGTISRSQLQVALIEVAEKIKEEVRQRASEDDLEQLTSELKKPLQDIIAKLPEVERKRLLQGFAN